MLIHYFLAGLKPVVFGDKLPISRPEYMHRAKDCLSERMLFDLELLESFYEALSLFYSLITHGRAKDLDEQVSSPHLRDLLSVELALDPSRLSFAYWHMLRTKSKSRFLRTFADEAEFLLRSVALLLASSHDHEPEARPQEYGDESHVVETSLMRHPHYQRLQQALADPDPMALEQMIMYSLFAMADELSDNDVFALDQVLVYYIKLGLCERQKSFDKERGLSILQDLDEKILQEARL